MTDLSKIRLDFGVPSHGWLPTKFHFKDFSLEIAISNVPSNPMLQLCNSLLQIIKGIRTPDRVIWHLEPHTYYLQLEKVGDEYKVSVSESDAYEGPATFIEEISGDFEAIVLPFYRALKKFYSKSYQSPHWEPLESARIETLTTLVKQFKQN